MTAARALTNARRHTRQAKDRKGRKISIVGGRGCSFRRLKKHFYWWRVYDKLNRQIPAEPPRLASGAGCASSPGNQP